MVNNVLTYTQKIKKSKDKISDCNFIFFLVEYLMRTKRGFFRDFACCFFKEKQGALSVEGLK